MVPTIVKHKRNGHRAAPPATESLGAILRMVHSVREQSPTPSYELLRFQNVVRSEHVDALVTQAAREVDALHAALAPVLARTGDAFARGEMVDVRDDLLRLRERADLAARMMNRLVAETAGPAAGRQLLRPATIVAGTLDRLGRGPRPIPVAARIEPDLPWLAAHPRQLEYALTTIVGRIAADSKDPVALHLGRGPVGATGTPVVLVTVVRSGPPLPADAVAALARDAASPAAPAGPDLELYVASSIVAEHGGAVRIAPPSEDGVRVIVELPAI